MKILSLLILVSSCLALHAEWLPREIHEVRAYVYDYKQEDGNLSLLHQGRLHKGIINAGGTKLSDEQIKNLMNALETASSPLLLPVVTCHTMVLCFSTKTAKPWATSSFASNVETLRARLREFRIHIGTGQQFVNC